MDITAEMVKDLRERTGIGMMECKRALEESSGDQDKAIEILRKKGYARAAEKADRAASEGRVGAYIHTNGKIGVLVEVNCETDFVAKNEEFQDLVKNIAMHIAAANPKYVAPADIPADILEKEREIIREQFKDSKKPAEIVEKIVEGKLTKFYEETCLLEQPYIRDDKMKVKDLLTQFISKFKENTKVGRFTRYQIVK
ncbi:MAG: translation elongation factor Ts [Candidatus Aminicenantes bacterium]|nr:translation elongation factor Ts [Candidatus Aminicenantes bacterium]